MTTRYCIVRFFYPNANGNSEESQIIDTGLTLEEAQAHCQDPTTREEGKWFDGYTEE